MEKDIFTLLGLLLTFIGLIYTAEQIRRARKVSLADFLLRLDEQMKEHDSVHLKLRPGGEWSDGNTGPQTAEDWACVEKYMGLFERINIMVESNILPMDIVKRFYGYRVGNIINNKTIYETKLVKRRVYWQDFFSLSEKLGFNV